MDRVISNTSPLYYLNKIGLLDCLPKLFGSIWVPEAVVRELAAGKQQGCQVPDLQSLAWVSIINPSHSPSE